MSKARKADIIRIGDEIKIINPIFYIRCGYPMDVKEETEKVFSEHRKSVEKLMMDVGIALSNSFQVLHSPFESNLYKICRELAYAKCKFLKFGGRTRALYTEEIPQLNGLNSRVLEVKCVKTGNYCPASSRHGYYDEPDYDPAELNNQKTHKLIKVYLHHETGFFERWIEAIHVEKIIFEED